MGVLPGGVRLQLGLEIRPALSRSVEARTDGRDARGGRASELGARREARGDARASHDAEVVIGSVRPGSRASACAAAGRIRVSATRFHVPGAFAGRASSASSIAKATSSDHLRLRGIPGPTPPPPRPRPSRRSNPGPQNRPPSLVVVVRRVPPVRRPCSRPPLPRPSVLAFLFALCRSSASQGACFSFSPRARLRRLHGGERAPRTPRARAPPRLRDPSHPGDDRDAEARRGTWELPDPAPADGARDVLRAQRPDRRDVRELRLQILHRVSGLTLREKPRGVTAAISAAVPDEAAATRASVPTNRASGEGGRGDAGDGGGDDASFGSDFSYTATCCCVLLEGHELRDVTPARHRGGRAIARDRCRRARAADRTDARGKCDDVVRAIALRSRAKIQLCVSGDCKKKCYTRPRVLVDIIHPRRPAFTSRLPRTPTASARGVRGPRQGPRRGSRRRRLLGAATRRSTPAHLPRASSATHGAKCASRAASADGDDDAETPVPPRTSEEASGSTFTSGSSPLERPSIRLAATFASAFEASSAQPIFGRTTRGARRPCRS